MCWGFFSCQQAVRKYRQQTYLPFSIKHWRKQNRKETFVTVILSFFVVFFVTSQVCMCGCVCVCVFSVFFMPELGCCYASHANRPSRCPTPTAADSGQLGFRAYQLRDSFSVRATTRRTRWVHAPRTVHHMVYNLASNEGVQTDEQHGKTTKTAHIPSSSQSHTILYRPSWCSCTDGFVCVSEEKRGFGRRAACNNKILKDRRFALEIVQKVFH